MSANLRKILLISVLAPALVMIISAATPDRAAAFETITLRSGNASPGSSDPIINVLVGTGGAPLSNAPFTGTDFQAACSGGDAMVLTPHPVWLQQLYCDPEARWIGIDNFNTPASALYCHEFEVETCCIESALLYFCWAADDILGDDLYGGPNPAGVYLNGVAVTPTITGGNYATETLAEAVDVTNLIRCGTNRLQVYNRDAGFVVSGVIYSALIDIHECATPTSLSSWGSIKTLYR